MRADSARLREFAARYTAAWCSPDSTRPAPLYSVEGSLSLNSGTPAARRNAIAEAARSFTTAFPDNSAQKIYAFGLSPRFNKVFTMVRITKYAGLFPSQSEALAAL